MTINTSGSPKIPHFYLSTGFPKAKLWDITQQSDVTDLRFFPKTSRDRSQWSKTGF